MLEELYAGERVRTVLGEWNTAQMSPCAAGIGYAAMSPCAAGIGQVRGAGIG